MAPTQTFRKFVEPGDVRGIVTFQSTSSFEGVPTIAQASYPDLDGLGVNRLIAAPPSSQVLCSATQGCRYVQTARTGLGARVSECSAIRVWGTGPTAAQVVTP